MRAGGVAEGDTSGDSLSWTGSQLVNDALARFQAASVAVAENNFLSVTGSTKSTSLDDAEHAKLE